MRWRLALAFTGVVTVVIAATAIGMAALVSHAVWGPLDAALAEEADTLTTIRDAGSEAELVRAVERIGREADLGPGKFIQVLDARGGALAVSGSMPAALGAPARGAGGGEAPPAPRGREEVPGSHRGDAPPDRPLVEAATVGTGADAYRVVAYAVAGRGSVRLGVPAARQVGTLRQARLAIGVGAAVLVGTLFVLVLAITARATAELERVARELETVEAGSLDRRLSTRRTREVDRLVRVLNRLLARLEEAMTHLRRFTADAAHELRTPVAALRAHLEVTLGRARSLDTSREGLLDALEQTERLGRLAEDLLTLSAVESDGAGAAARREPVRLDALVHEVSESIEPLAEEQGRAFTVTADAAVTVTGSAALLKRVMLNLVDNALRHTSPGVAVHLSVRADDGGAVLTVRDAGPGIAPEELPHVFERFRHGTHVHGGSGLGLALCREIVTRHGGSITLTSAPGCGVTATVRLPLSPVAAVAPAP